MLSQLHLAKACKAFNGKAAVLLTHFQVPVLQSEHGGSESCTSYLSGSDGSKTSTDSKFEVYDFKEIGTLYEQDKLAEACFGGTKSSAGNCAAFS